MGTVTVITGRAVPESLIDRVETFKHRGGRGKWPRINRAKFAEGVKDRIVLPDMIDQGKAPVCGPAGFVRALATDHPGKYADLAIDLYERGEARLNRLTIKPSRKLRFAQPRPSIDPADWVVLASLRDSHNFTFSVSDPGFVGGIGGITLPGRIVDWFHKAGYGDVIDETIIAPRPVIRYSSAIRSARFASRLYSQGYYVMLFIAADMLYASRQGGGASVADHWVALTSIIRIGQGAIGDRHVSFSVYTWGDGRRSVPQDPNKPLQLRDFAANYFGFVAARV